MNSSQVLNENDTCTGGYAREDMGECRMDLVDSELAHMGYEATESYGITWKVSTKNCGIMSLVAVRCGCRFSSDFLSMRCRWLQEGSSPRLCPVTRLLSQRCVSQRCVSMWRYVSCRAHCGEYWGIVPARAVSAHGMYLLHGLSLRSSHFNSLSIKVRGFCTDMSNPEVFEDVNVYGDITNCNIHHMWYGMYSYGHQGGVWTDNLMHGKRKTNGKVWIGRDKAHHSGRRREAWEEKTSSRLFCCCSKYGIKRDPPVTSLYPS